MSDLVINHEEALQLAHLRREESNLARCYIDQRDRIEALEEALAFYADIEAWADYEADTAARVRDRDTGSALGSDKGKIARATLTPSETK